MKRKHFTEPIKSKDEHDEVMEFCIQQTVRVAKVSREEAVRRMKDLFTSGELKDYLPTNPMFQLIVDKYMLNQHKSREN
jgi:hypothetical protein